MLLTVRAEDNDSQPRVSWLLVGPSVLKTGIVDGGTAEIGLELVVGLATLFENNLRDAPC